VATATITNPEASAALVDKRQLEHLELELLLTGVARRYGYDFRDYARPALLRRLRLAQRREGAKTLTGLLDRVLHDAAAMARVVEIVAVHTTAMFRDAEFHAALRSEVVPLLRTYPFVRIWYAGCGTGEDVYGLAIVLHEEGLLDRCRMYATDVSEIALDRARAGRYPLRDLRDWAAAYRRAGGIGELTAYYTSDDANAVMRPSLRDNVLFSHHNLATDGAFQEFQLVLCRNVLSHYDAPLRNRALSLLSGSLSRFGVLGLGPKETLQGSPVEERFHEVLPGVRLFRRLG
jgi:chemotaxis protein methyltransferase CheR